MPYVYSSLQSQISMLIHDFDLESIFQFHFKFLLPWYANMFIWLDVNSIQLCICHSQLTNLTLIISPQLIIIKTIIINFHSLMERKTIRLRVKTNKQINMIVAIEADKSMQQLAHRVLNCFHELLEQKGRQKHFKRRDLTVSALKIQNFFISKHEIVGNMLKDNDEIECILSKAKPKYPKYPKAYESTIKNLKSQVNTPQSFDEFEVHIKENSRLDSANNAPTQQKNKSKRQIKKEKQREKEKKKKLEQMNKDMEQRQIENLNRLNLFPKQLKTSQHQPFNPLNTVVSPQKIFQKFNIELKQKTQDKRIFPKSIEPKNKDRDSFNGEEKQNIINNPAFNTQSKIATNLKEKLSNEVENNQKEIQNINENLDNKKLLSSPKQQQQSAQPPSNNNKQKQSNSKKNNHMKSILGILTKANEEKQKKLKQKEKKLQKQEENFTEKLNDKFNNQNTNKQAKVQKEFPPVNKIASPKVTFHNSPMSPQMMSLNSPKRKASNTPIQKIQKMDLEAPIDIAPNKSAGKQAEKDKRNSIPIKVEPAVDNSRQKQKKQIPAPFSGAPKIIVEEQSQSESNQNQFKQKQQKTTAPPKKIQQPSNPKIAALNAKLSKYSLQFFGQSDDQ